MGWLSMRTPSISKITPLSMLHLRQRSQARPLRLRLFIVLQCPDVSQVIANGVSRHAPYQFWQHMKSNVGRLRRRNDIEDLWRGNQNSGKCQIANRHSRFLDELGDGPVVVH